VRNTRFGVKSPPWNGLLGLAPRVPGIIENESVVDKPLGALGGP
jgi:hypothetical protein